MGFVFAGTMWTLAGSLFIQNHSEHFDHFKQDGHDGHKKARPDHLLKI